MADLGVGGVGVVVCLVAVVVAVRRFAAVQCRTSLLIRVLVSVRKVFRGLRWSPSWMSGPCLVVGDELSARDSAVVVIPTWRSDRPWWFFRFCVATIVPLVVGGVLSVAWSGVCVVGSVGRALVSVVAACVCAGGCQ